MPECEPLTVRQVARIVRRTKRVVRGWIYTGRLEAEQLGGPHTRICIDPRYLLSWLQEAGLSEEEARLRMGANAPEKKRVPGVTTVRRFMP
jgi:hypothetical protein